MLQPMPRWMAASELGYISPHGIIGRTAFTALYTTGMALFLEPFAEDPVYLSARLKLAQKEEWIDGHEPPPLLKPCC